MQDGSPERAVRPSQRKLILIASTIVAITIAAVVAAWVCIRACELSRRSNCIVNLRAIGYAIQCYQVNNHVFPGPDPLGVLVAAKLIETHRTRCPNGGSYIVLIRTHSADTDADPRRVVAYEPISNHDKVANILFADGHAESVKESAFKPPR